MNNEQWNRTATEQNAKAEQVGAAIAVGCIGVPIFIILFIFVIVALIG